MPVELRHGNRNTPTNGRAGRARPRRDVSGRPSSSYCVQGARLSGYGVPSHFGLLDLSERPGSAMEGNRDDNGRAIDITASTGSGDWREKALCTQVPGDVWFPEGGENPRAAKRICGWCEVQAECLAFALKTNEQHGIWGGLSAVSAGHCGLASGARCGWLRARPRDGRHS